jgi:hypothetical protein
MVHFTTPSGGGQVFSVGSICFCGSLPYNNFDNNISTLLHNVITRFTSEEHEASEHGIVEKNEMLAGLKLHPSSMMNGASSP